MVALFAFRFRDKTHKIRKIPKHATFSGGLPAFSRQTRGSFLPQNRASAHLSRRVDCHLFLDGHGFRRSGVLHAQAAGAVFPEIDAAWEAF
jgi:hypothetical protein